MPQSEIVDIAAQARRKLGKQVLTEHQAKLYSQSLLKKMGREGISSFNEDSIKDYIREASLLIHYAFLERKNDPQSKWKNGIKRAGEIFEWLSQRELLPEDAPFHLLAAGAYQVAGYPALALGHLRDVPQHITFSRILSSYLSANFLKTRLLINEYWAEQIEIREEEIEFDTDLSVLPFNHMLMALGVVCDFLRTGKNDKVDRALSKLDKLAGGFLYSNDQYSWILARLISEISETYVKTCLWTKISSLTDSGSDNTKKALSQFCKSSFVNNRSLVWPAQAVGIRRLADNSSFVLCTPTGTGKTTIATLASIQALYIENDEDLELSIEEFNNLVLYLVPSRALAAEVEERLSQDLKNVSSLSPIITGLYGGIDWGPTDAWISRDQPTVLICTFEKADALIRYLGILFLNRVRLIVIDEAHMVEHTEYNNSNEGPTRSFRLEMLGTRLLRAQAVHNFRLIALSAVAAKSALALSRWISGDQDAEPAKSKYRSTRQMIGRLEVAANGHFKIEYDLMNGHSLKFQDGSHYIKPFINSPFPDLPDGLSLDSGPLVRMRAPTLWAALHLASIAINGKRSTVLISISQKISDFADSCLELLDGWPAEELPDYFAEPENNEQWEQCVSCAADYFSEESLEYKLLKRGILIHHGKMPALMARKLKKVIDAGLINVVIATSTLSEGVNIPVNYILLPSVRRRNEPFSVQEFGNLVGRSGRPGVSTEGHTLVVLPPKVGRRDYERDAYDSLVAEIENLPQEEVPDDGSSPLAALIKMLKKTWMDINGGTEQQFLHWLEQTAPATADEDESIKALDTLDSFLIASIQEMEKLRGDLISSSDMEAELIRIWQATYARASAHQEDLLRSIWLKRGKAIKTIYSDQQQRENIYKTSLSPRSAIQLITESADLKELLVSGSSYAEMSKEEKLSFIAEVIETISNIPAFKLSDRLGGRQAFDWKQVLRWWFDRESLDQQPNPKQISEWYDYVSKNFSYKATWGIGSLLNLLMGNEEDGEPIRPLEIEDWPRTGLPWIAFWLKELITWGTLDPVAAYLLARTGSVSNRYAALEQAQHYYHEQEDIDANDLLDPRIIRDWARSRSISPNHISFDVEETFSVRLVRPSDEYLEEHITVHPVISDEDVLWIDSAGYSVAKSIVNQNIWAEKPDKYEFYLNVANRQINAFLYLRYEQNN